MWGGLTPTPPAGVVSGAPASWEPGLLASLPQVALQHHTAEHALCRIRTQKKGLGAVSTVSCGKGRAADKGLSPSPAWRRGAPGWAASRPWSSLGLWPLTHSAVGQSLPCSVSTANTSQGWSAYLKSWGGTGHHTSPAPERWTVCRRVHRRILHLKQASQRLQILTTLCRLAGEKH